MGFSARFIVKGVVCLTVLSAIMGYPLKRAEAGHGIWNTQVCEITGTDSRDLVEAMDLYNSDVVSSRGCTWLISFLDRRMMFLHRGLIITGAPVRPGDDGATYGVIISRPSDGAFTLDASGLGDCPITIRGGSKVDLMRITLKVDNVNRAVCNDYGLPLYNSLGAGGHVTAQDDTQMDTAYIHSDVTIVRSDDRPIDTDGDGILDSVDNCPEFASLDLTNTDGDGLGNLCDPDDDNDLVLDDRDECAGTPTGTRVDARGCPARGALSPLLVIPPLIDVSPFRDRPWLFPPAPWVDTDGDGILDSVDNCPAVASLDLTDTDGDGQGNPCDTDDDNDGMPDVADNCPLAANPTQTDTDGDRIGDACDPPPVVLDSDWDGVIDSVDNCPSISNTVQTNTDGAADGGNACDPDDDNDGVLDVTDNCPLVLNPTQTDTDGDGQGNPCDPDDDNDGVLDVTDNCPLVPNLTQTDTDGDRVGDACDAPSGGLDSDGDGVIDSVDNCDTTPSTDLADTDGDGLGNPCDTDDDGDGVLDVTDNCRFVANPAQADTDSDGIGDACDTALGGVGCVDADGDGLCDSRELGIGTDPNNPDTDGDGASDSGDCAPLDPAHSSGASCAFGGGSNNDLDGDGVPNATDNCVGIPNPAPQVDSDGDGFGDLCDPSRSVSPNDTDSDGDGIPDAQEADYGTDPNNADTDGDGLIDGDEVLSPFYPVCGPLDPDCDNDGVCDGPGTVTGVCAPFDGHGDNCELVSNGPATPGIVEEEIQRDANANGIGDACEGDFDGDSVPDRTDNCPFNPNTDQTDNNNNDIGDVCDLSLAFFKGGGGPGGCGCRIDDKSAGSNQDLLAFLTMGLPLVLFRVMRKKLRR